MKAQFQYRIDIYMEQALLSRMSDLLESDGTNYSVFLKAFSCEAQGPCATENVVKELVGKDAVIAHTRACTFEEVAEELRRCLGYVGDESAGPGPDTLRLQEFSLMLKALLNDVAQVGKRSNAIKSFRFSKGNPAYPVFWEFAFLFLGEEMHELIVGSSSD
jgi:hypothetical protein